MKLTLDTILVIVSGIASWLTALTGLIFGYKSWKTSKVDAAKQFMEAENSEELFKARHAIYSCKDIFKVTRSSCRSVKMSNKRNRNNFIKINGLVK